MRPPHILCRSLLAGLALLGAALAIPADASVVISGTRVVYRAPEKEVTVRLTNEGSLPALTQVWLDQGDPRADPATLKVPFLVTPPVMRIDAGKAQTLRLMYTGEALPQDRESVFWLNVLEVPPKPKADDAPANLLQLSFRSRIKVFFRPQGLKGAVQDAPAQLQWRLAHDGGKLGIEVRNPTAYHVSFASIDVNTGGQHAVFDDGGMVGPGETRAFPLKGELKGDVKAGGATVHYRCINDHGGVSEGDATTGDRAGA